MMTIAEILTYGFMACSAYPEGNAGVWIMSVKNSAPFVERGLAEPILIRDTQPVMGFGPPFEIDDSILGAWHLTAKGRETYCAGVS